MPDILGSTLARKDSCKASVLRQEIETASLLAVPWASLALVVLMVGRSAEHIRKLWYDEFRSVRQGSMPHAWLQAWDAHLSWKDKSAKVSASDWTSYIHMDLCHLLLLIISSASVDGAVTDAPGCPPERKADLDCISSGQSEIRRDLELTFWVCVGSPAEKPGVAPASMEAKLENIPAEDGSAPPITVPASWAEANANASWEMLLSLPISKPDIAARTCSELFVDEAADDCARVDKDAELLDAPVSSPKDHKLRSCSSELFPV